MRRLDTAGELMQFLPMANWMCTRLLGMSVTVALLRELPEVTPARHSSCQEDGGGVPHFRHLEHKLHSYVAAYKPLPAILSQDQSHVGHQLLRTGAPHYYQPHSR